MLFATLDIRRDDYDFEGVRRMIGVWRQAADLILHGDYYPHTPFHKSADQWVAWQFDRPETGRGFVQTIRLPACPQDAITLNLKGIRPEAIYVFTNPETGERREMTGGSLLHDGFTAALPPRSGAVWFYSCQAPDA